MFNKEEQKRRAAEFSQQQKSLGKVAPAPQSVPYVPMQTIEPRMPQIRTPQMDLDEKHRIKLAAIEKKAREYERAPWRNSEGQVLSYGDYVLVITTGYSHRTVIRTGTYLGLTRDRRNNVSALKVQVVDRNGNPTITSVPSLRVFALRM